MTLEQWSQLLGPAHQSALHNLISVLGYSSPAQFPPVHVEVRELNPKETEELSRNIGKCFIHNRVHGPALLCPLVPHNHSVMPILLANPGFPRVESPIVSMSLHYSIRYLHWHMKMRTAGPFPDAEEEGALHCMGVYDAEYNSFVEYLLEMQQAGIPVNTDSIKKSSIQFSEEEFTFSLINGVLLRAKENALLYCDRQLWTDPDQDLDIHMVFDGKLGGKWKELQNFFNRTRSFEEAMQDKTALKTLVREMSGTGAGKGKESDDSHAEAVYYSDQCALLIREGRIDASIEAGEKALELYEIRPGGKSHSIAASNLLGAYFQGGKIGKAEKFYPRFIEIAEAAGDLLGLAMFPLQVMYYFSIVDTPGMTRELNRSLDALERMTGQDFQKEASVIGNILEDQKQQLFLLQGTPEAASLADRWGRQYSRLGG